MDTKVIRFSVGDVNCAAISVGQFFAPARPTICMNAPDRELGEGLDAHHLQPSRIPFGWCYLFLDTGRHRILVDPGRGTGGLVPSTSALLERLRSASVQASDIDVVLLSHAHFDHAAGTIDESGEPVFPRARCILAREEYAFWSAEPDLGQMAIDEPTRKSLRSFARTWLAQMREYLELTEYGAEIVPGVQIIAAPGHTPGHMAIAVSSRGERLLYIGDMVYHSVQIEHSNWCSVFDFAPDQAIATRHRLFEQAAREKMLVMGYHFAFPAVGRIAQLEAGWRWLAMPTPERSSESVA